MNKDNYFISFYGKHDISPVHQNILDFRIHLTRREKLYRTLGLPVIFFKNRKVLEIGPGGGYNGLTLFYWGASVDFIEPNKTAQKELPCLLNQYKIKKQKWSLFSGKLEEFPLTKTYDLVLAEGFLPGLNSLNQRAEIIRRITKLLNPGGIIVVTCVDQISCYLEFVRRAIAQKLLTQLKIECFDDKVEILSQAFQSHLKQLKGASRPIKDWVIDQFLNPALINGVLFSIADAISEFGEKFTFFNSCPDIFTDYSWYKDLRKNRNQEIIDQFWIKRHGLLSTRSLPIVRSRADNEKLTVLSLDFLKNLRSFEQKRSPDSLNSLYESLVAVEKIVKPIDKNVSLALSQGATLLKDKNISLEKIKNARYLRGEFGKGQQYVSLIKNK